ncbi:DedA family protein [Gracilibacillus alcaliphilus]|uniref:DedA family protein n=1 Tax=Gracilibacillus alcaliphilus TaxID=1401441 RepID=UPI00195D64B3|nr:DedA family protein [Gracilibacillus alcaliphilus]MBM7677771.1 membrane protein DedA with SNARE-associated domain [Gracilibacillus alcaliphilus]
MQAFITRIMEEFGYWGILLMMAVENIFPPIPSEIVLPFSGFMTTYSSLTVLGVVTVATTGSLIGAVVLYGIGLYLNTARLERIIEKWGHILRISKHDIHKADEWFNKYGYWTILFCRMVPLIRSLISIPAGMAKMNFTLFVFFTTIGTLIWNILLITAGVMLGENWRQIVDWIDTYSYIIYFLLLIGAIILAYLFYKRRIRKKQTRGGK